MQDTEIYEEFIEGKLSADSEQKLMARLTFDNELRTNFKHYLLVTSSIRNFVENEAIPDRVSNKLFASLGFSPIINSVPIPNKPKQSFFKSKFFTATMSSMITLIIVFLYLDFFGVKNNGRNEIERNYTVQSPFYDYIYNFNKPSNDNSSNNSKVKQNLLNQSEEPIIYANRKSKKSEFYQTKTEMIDKNNEIMLSPAIFEDKNFAFINPKIDNNDNKKFQNLDFNATYDTIYFIRRFDSKFRFEFKNTPSWFADSPIVQPQNLSNFNNLSVAIFYPIYKNLNLGAEFRQETFYLNYDDRDRLGQDYTYYMQPNLSTIGLALRYIPFDLGCCVKPYGQISFGLNTSGMVTREVLGLELQVYENTYMLFGIEANQFFYQHLNKWYSTNKFSLNYGFGVKF